MNARAYAVAAEQVAWWMTQGMSPEDMYEAMTDTRVDLVSLDIVIGMLARKWLDMREQPELRVVA